MDRNGDCEQRGKPGIINWPWRKYGFRCISFSLLFRFINIRRGVPLSYRCSYRDRSRNVVLATAISYLNNMGFGRLVCSWKGDCAVLHLLGELMRKKKFRTYLFINVCEDWMKTLPLCGGGNAGQCEQFNK